MSRKKINGSTALATIDAAPPARQITRSQANALLKSRALELYHEARTRREEQIRAFEGEYGRIDRIDHTVLADLQRIQARLAAIAARQQRTASNSAEPKVSKQVEMLGQLIGSISAYLATERALELFAPIQQADYIGWNGGGIGPKGTDEALLAGYEIVDDPLGPKNVTPSADEDGEVCLHVDIEPYEEDPSLGVCVECGEEFGLRPSVLADSEETPQEQEPAPEPVTAK
jgi:hypothetical protein